MSINEILSRLMEQEKAAGIYIGDHYSLQQLITDLEELRDEENDNYTDSHFPDAALKRLRSERVLDAGIWGGKQFCASCGAGVGRHRRVGEGTCQLCDPEGVARNAERNKRLAEDS